MILACNCIFDIFDFGKRVMVVSENELGSVSSSAIFWNFQKVGVKSSLNV